MTNADAVRPRVIKYYFPLKKQNKIQNKKSIKHQVILSHNNFKFICYIHNNMLLFNYVN